jgi:hypothetical protein
MDFLKSLREILLKELFLFLSRILVRDKADVIGDQGCWSHLDFAQHPICRR